ncbi:MAG: cupin domain-containing protein [Saprospiraceae bacterium]|nr:cupin domain-containing protein [Saprospiraceae bacterium]
MVKKLANSDGFRAGDNTWLREILHPANDNVNTGFSLAHAYLEAGESSLPHKLVTSSETYFILEGSGTIVIEGQKHRIGKGDTVFVPANATQSVQNTGSDRLIFLCIVSPPWAATDEEIDGQ